MRLQNWQGGDAAGNIDIRAPSSVREDGAPVARFALNFIERELPFVQRDATLVTVFAGGNDANTVGAALLQAGYGKGPRSRGYAQAQVTRIRVRDLRTLMTGIRTARPTRAIILNLPQRAALPDRAGRTLNEKCWLQQISVGSRGRISVGSGGRDL